MCVCVCVCVCVCEGVGVAELEGRMRACPLLTLEERGLTCVRSQLSWEMEGPLADSARWLQKPTHTCSSVNRLLREWGEREREREQ